MKTRFCPICKTETAFYIGIQYGQHVYECVNCGKLFVRRKKERNEKEVAA